MNITTDKPGVSDSGTLIPAGTACTYDGHVVGGMVRVTLPDGVTAILHPHMFACFR